MENVYFGRGVDIGNPSATKRWESMTYDGPGGLYYGWILNSTLTPDGKSQVLSTTFPATVDKYLGPIGLQVAVLDGAGIGQVSRVTAVNGARNAWTVSPPFAVPLATNNSVITIIPHRGPSVFEGNAYLQDTTFQVWDVVLHRCWTCSFKLLCLWDMCVCPPSPQLFGTAYDVVAAGNFMQNTSGGFQAWGLWYQGGYQPNNNILFESNTATCSGGVRSLSISAGPDPVLPYTGPYNRLLTYRNNVLLAGSNVDIDGITWDVLSENNVIAAGQCVAGGPTLPPGSVMIGKQAERVHQR